MFIAKLYVEDEEFNVLEFRVDYNQGADGTGRPSTSFRGGQYYMVVEATKSTTVFA